MALTSPSLTKAIPISHQLVSFANISPRAVITRISGSLGSEIDNAVTPLCRANQTSCAVDVSGSITAKARGTGRKFNDFSHACELETQPSGMAPRATV